MHCRDIADALLAALFSSPCVVCGRVLDHPTQGAACNDCWRAVRLITPPICQVCGEPLASGRIGPSDNRAPALPLSCAACSARRPRITIARAVGAYEGTLREKFWREGRWLDAEFYSLLERDFAEARAAMTPG